MAQVRSADSDKELRRDEIDVTDASDRNQRTGKRFIVSFCVWFGCFLGLYLLAYRIIDPEEEYGTGIFPAPMANARVTKQTIFKKYSAKQSIDGLILGSSHCMTFEPSLARRLTGRTFFNFSVENAMIDDDLAIYRWVRKQGVHPKLLIIDLDVESFDPSDQVDARLADNDELYSTINGSRPPKISELASIASSWKRAMTIESAVAMAKGISLKMRSRPKTEMIDMDGHTVFTAYEQQVTDGSFNLGKSISSAIPVYTDKYKSMDRLSPRRENWLHDLVGEASQDHCKVILWVPPFHPDLARALDATPYPARLADTLKFANVLASDYRDSVAVCDLSLITKFGGNDIDWIDGAHMNKENSARALERLLAADHDF